MWILLNRLLRLQHPASHHHCHQSSSTLRSGSCAVGCDGIRRRYGKAYHRRRNRACCCCSSYSSSFHSRGNSSGRPGDEPDAGLEQRVRVGRQHERGQRHDGTAHVAGLGPAGGAFGAGREPLVKEWNARLELGWLVRTRPPCGVGRAGQGKTTFAFDPRRQAQTDKKAFPERKGTHYIK
jgi:hypothetical protein